MDTIDDLFLNSISGNNRKQKLLPRKAIYIGLAIVVFIFLWLSLHPSVRRLLSFQLLVNHGGNSEFRIMTASS
jgi:hypothetical protein